jgi:RNA polymerase sigma factor (sigma-70 family)
LGITRAFGPNRAGRIDQPTPDQRPQRLVVVAVRSRRVPMARRTDRVRGYAEVVGQAGASAGAVWRYRDDVWRLARQLCRHREDAEDVAHSALLKAAEHLDGFRWEASLRTWLHRIATNECRMLRRRKVPLSLEALLEDAATAEHRPPEPAAGEPGPEEAAVEAETRRSVLAALQVYPTTTAPRCFSRTGWGCARRMSPRRWASRCRRPGRSCTGPGPRCASALPLPLTSDRCRLIGRHNRAPFRLLAHPCGWSKEICRCDGCER